MGASDLTTDKPNAGNGEVVDDNDRPRAAKNGHSAKKRKKQKALAAVAANGHAKGPASNGSVVADERTLELPAVEPAEVTQEIEEVAEVEIAEDIEELDEVGLAEDLFDDEDPAAVAEEDPAGGGRGSRRRAAKRARAAEAEPKVGRRAARRARAAEAETKLGRRAARKARAAEAEPRVGRRAARKARAAEAEPKLRRRAAKRAEAARRATPAGRRAQLVATAASIAAAAEAREAPAAKYKRIGKYARRLAALVALLMLPGAVYALAVTKGPVSDLPQADAAFLSEQLITADQRVRKQLVRLRPLHTSAAIARTRESQLTARSLAIELDSKGGARADRLQRALKLEAAWLDAVGSVLANPRSALGEELVARDVALRSALKALPSTEGLRRKGGSQQLRDFARSRIAAKH